MLMKLWPKRNTHPLLVAVKIDAVTMKISVMVPQEVENLPLSRSSHIMLGNRPNKSFILSQRQLLNHVHSCSIHNNQILKTT